jgi:TolB-like protein
MGKKYFSLVSVSVLLGMGFGLTGCMGGPSINLKDYKKVSLTKSKFATAKKKQAGTAKIIIMNIDNNGIANAEKINLGKSLASNINKELSENKNVRVLKRISSDNYEKILSKEIKAAEVGKELGEDVGQANYLVSGQLSNVTYTNKFTEASSYVDKDGKSHYTAPSIKYEACVQGTLKVFSLPELQEQETKSFDECSSSSEQARSPRDAKASNGTLEREAGAEAMDSVAYTLKSFFTPKAYISKMKKDGDTKIIEVGVGKKQGVKNGDEVNIFTMTNDGPVQIGEGEVTNKITNTKCWVMVTDLEDDATIKQGDYVKVIYKEGTWSKLGKTVDVGKLLGF